jgi:hypothetical protein
MHRFVCLSAAVLLIAGVARAEPPRATMHRVFGAISVLLPLSLDEQRFAAPDAQESIAREIQRLTGAARELENHGVGRDRSFLFLSRSLAADVEEIRYRYDFGRLEEARFFVLESTRNCVACHSRLPSTSADFALADQLLDKIDLASLSHHERSQLYVIARQFERALDNWEELFGEWLVSPGQLDAGGYLRDYLTVAIRVDGNRVRARKTLEKLRRRPNLPDYLVPQLDQWIRDLRELESKKLPTELAAIRSLVESAPSGDAHSMVTDLVASAALLRYIDRRAVSEASDEERARAYYLLGVVEARTVESFWVPQAPFHLEAAIRLDPAGPDASHALSLIEEQFTIGYGGLDAEALPIDLWTKLQELRSIVASRS